MAVKSVTSIVVTLFTSLAAVTAAPRIGARVAGSTMEADSHVPLPDCKVTLRSQDGAFTAETSSDAGGHFTFASIPPGRYLLSAAMPPYVGAHYLANSIDDEGVPIVVSDGQNIKNLVLEFDRGGVVAGTVKDAAGRGLADLEVAAYRRQALPGGEFRLVALSDVTATVTSSSGEYRLFGLPRGRYVILARPRPQGRTTSDAGLAAGPRPSVFRDERGVTYGPTFYPSSPDLTSAELVEIDSGTELGGVDVHARPVETSSIAGSVTGGFPESECSAWLREQTLGLPERVIYSACDHAAFSFSGLLPGTYSLTMKEYSSREHRIRWARQVVSVPPGTAVNVVITPAAGTEVLGRLSSVAKAVPVTLRLFDADVATGPEVSAAVVGTDGSFAFGPVPPGTYRLRADGAGADTLDIRDARGLDAEDCPFAVMPGVDPVHLTGTAARSTGSLSGTVRDRAGAFVTNVSVVLVPSARACWNPASRRVMWTRPDTTGQYEFRAVVPGEYRVVAVAQVDVTSLYHAEFMEAADRAGIPLTLSGEGTRMDLMFAGAGNQSGRR